MPKHVFEQVEDPTKFDFNPPVTIGPYKLHSFDPNGKWYIWEKREDWQRTSLARHGEPGPKYAAYIDPGPPDKRVILQLNHQLDIIHDTSPEGVFSLVKQSPTSQGWFKGFPYAHPDPTLPAVLFNHQVKPFDNPDVRWALALLIDIKAVSMASYRGAATISAIGVPPTGLYGKYYFDPMEDWLKNFEIDTGKSKYKPYDPTVGQQIAQMLRPSMGEQIPTDPKEIANAIGRGWWKPNPEAATQLLERAGFTKQGDQWLKPDGTPFSITLLVEGDQRPVMTRAGTMIVQQWRQFGIDAKTQAYPSRPVSLPRQLAFGIPEAERRAPAAAQPPALDASGAGQDHREDPHDRLRRSEGTGARPGIYQARGPGDAYHPADVVQRVHHDGYDLLDGIPKRG
jgi:peptide/nickel transport system substrate-binding protein